MQELYDYQAYTVLFVDDEELTRKYFERNFKGIFKVVTAPDADTAKAVLSELGDEIAVVLSDQRMPGMSGTEFLEGVRKSHPHAIRMLVTAYSDMDATIAAINNGAVYKYITKPYEDFDLEVTVKRAIEFYIIQRERNALLTEKMGAMHRSILTERVLSMGVLSAGISHHLRNSLTAVQAFLDMAPDKLQSETNAECLNDPVFWEDLYGVAQQQVCRVVDMLKEVECYATITESSFSDEINLSEAINAGFKEGEADLKSAGVQLDVSEIDPKVTIIGDKRLFNSAFSMFFKDAGCFLPVKSGLKLRSALLSGNNKPDKVVLSIDGLCAETNLEDIIPLFDPFRINGEKPSEWGVNLLGAFFLIYHHGGTIDLVSDSENSKKIQITLSLDANVPLNSTTHQGFMEKVFRLERRWEDHLIGV